MVLIPFLFISSNDNVTGIQSCNNFDISMYLASVVLRAIWVCILESHMIRNIAYIIAYLLRDFTVLKSLVAVGLFQFPQNS